MGKQQAITELREILQKSFDAKYTGADMQRHSRVQGLADGYMRALVDLAIAEESELLAIVTDERKHAVKRADTTTIGSSHAAAYA
jgi:hypothetical protein